MERPRLDQFKALGQKPGLILSAEARYAIPELVTEIERCWSIMAIAGVPQLIREGTVGPEGLTRADITWGQREIGSHPLSHGPKPTP